MSSYAARVGLLTVLSATLAGCDVWIWSVEHGDGDLLTAERPECANHWRRFPLYFDDDTYQKARQELLRGTKVRGLTLTDTRREFEFPLPSVPGTPSGPVGNVAGPITDIPEFHDCQKFVRRDVQEFDSLFAIFASFRLDSVVSELSWDNVTWSSSNPAVATVQAVTGQVTAVAAGTAAIIATSVLEPSRQAAATLVVQTTPSAFDGMSVSMNTPGLVVGIGETLRLIPLLGAQTSTTLAAAAVYSYGPGYEPLGIKANFSCLYLYFDNLGQLTAKMVHVDRLATYVHACLDAVNPAEAPGTILTIRRTQFGAASDYPPVARWDWDPKNRQHYIGIKCRDAWCEISGDVEGGTFMSSESYLPDITHLTSESRPVRIKGWYDEQFLAVRDVGGKMRPGVLGTVIPDESLGSLDSADFVGTWVPAAYIALQPIDGDTGAVAWYKSKLNLDPVKVQLPLTAMNQIYFCFGTKAECDETDSPIAASAKCPATASMGRVIHRWWVKVVSATLKDVRYSCVIRRGHEDFKEDIPSTARWRWILDDDTVWRECTQGCCEVETCLSGTC